VASVSQIDSRSERVHVEASYNLRDSSIGLKDRLCDPVHTASSISSELETATLATHLPSFERARAVRRKTPSHESSSKASQARVYQIGRTVHPSSIESEADIPPLSSASDEHALSLRSPLPDRAGRNGSQQSAMS
jgi:hypothetical protein